VESAASRWKKRGGSSRANAWRMVRWEDEPELPEGPGAVEQRTEQQLGRRQEGGLVAGRMRGRGVDMVSDGEAGIVHPERQAAERRGVVDHPAKLRHSD